MAIVKTWFLTLWLLMPGAEPDEVTILTLQAPSEALCIQFKNGWKMMATGKMDRGWVVAKPVEELSGVVVEVVSARCYDVNPIEMRRFNERTRNP